MEVLKLPNKSNPGSAVRAACSAAAFIPRIPFQSRWREINSSSKLCLLRLSLVGESWGGSVDLSKINLYLLCCLFLCSLCSLFSADLLENAAGSGFDFAGNGNSGQELSSELGKGRDGDHHSRFGEKARSG